jgi:hypothetical protein
MFKEFTNLKPNKKVNLETKVYDFSDMKGIKLPPGVTIDGHGATIKCHYNEDFSRQPFMFDDASKFNTFRNIRWDLKNNNVLILQGTGHQFINCSIVKGSNGVGIGRGVDRLTVDKLRDEGAFSGNAFGFFGSGASRPNSNIIITNSNIQFGSTGEHCYRFHSVDNVRVEGGHIATFNGKHPVNIRDGKNVTVKNCVLTGPIVIGPLELTGEEDKAMQSVYITDCFINGYILVYSGVTDLLLEKNKVSTSTGSYCISFRKPFGNRKEAAGIVRNNEFEYVGVGKLMSGNKSQQVLFTDNTFVNKK